MVFQNSIFTYAIKKLFEGKALDASFTDQKLTVYVPHDIQETWVNTDQVGLSQQLQFTD